MSVGEELTLMVDLEQRTVRNIMGGGSGLGRVAVRTAALSSETLLF